MPAQNGTQKFIYVSRKQVVAIHPWIEWAPLNPPKMIVGATMMVLMHDELYNPMGDEAFLGFGYEDELSVDRWQKEITEYKRRVAQMQAMQNNIAHAAESGRLQ